MKKHFNNTDDKSSLKDKIMGLGEKSMRKSYYPELQKRIRELEETNEKLRRHIQEKEAVQRAVIENEALLADIIHSQPTGTYRIRLLNKSNSQEGFRNKLFFDFISRQFIDIMGLEEAPDQFEPEIVAEKVHPDDRENFLKQHDLAIKAFTPFSWQGRIIVNNHEKWIDMESLSRKLANGDWVWTGVVTDLTARKKAEEALRFSEERFRLIFDSSPVGIVSYNEKGIIIACNHHFAEILKTNRNALLGNNSLQLPYKQIVSALKISLKGEKSVFEGELEDINGPTLNFIRIQFAPIFDKKGAVKGGVGILENFAERIRNQKLEQEIILSRKAVELKQNFLANMSHEIRTPLTGIEGMAHILAQTPLTEKQKDYLDTIITSSLNLREIINQILDYSKIEAGQMQIKTRTFKFQDLLHRVEGLLASLCTNKIPYKIIIPHNLPQHIETDDQKVFQIITNLVSNAVKYAPGGLITLELCRIPCRKAGKLRFKIRVTDQGPGISPEKQKDVFSPFSQLEQADMRSVEGTGLGLSISKELAGILGGTIGLESMVGQGSTFWFTFIANVADTAVEETFPPQQQAQAQKRILRILLVEDKNINQKVITLLLKSMGHAISIAGNGLIALDMFKPGLFDLVLMDIQMPVMDGIRATQKLKQTYTSLPPIVGLSANAFEGDKEKYINLGMDDYLTKPVNIKEFNQLLSRWFE
jgi:PAS domain S-box-containing protein